MAKMIMAHMVKLMRTANMKGMMSMRMDLITIGRRMQRSRTMEIVRMMTIMNMMHMMKSLRTMRLTRM